MFKSFEEFTSIANVIIRPPRAQYTTDQLGPDLIYFPNQMFNRRDFFLMNSRGLKVQWSFYEPTSYSKRIFPVVIYLHGNWASRTEALPLVNILLPRNILLFMFDFTGSGASEGDYVSLGYYEQLDLKVVIEFLRGLDNIGKIGIWGRSMGAVTSILYGWGDYSIAGYVLDSPFACLKDMWLEMARSSFKIPKSVTSIALDYLQKQVKSTIDLDIYTLNPIDQIGGIFAPAMFVSSIDDELVPEVQALELYDTYQGDKVRHVVEGSHNASRQADLLDTLGVFMSRILEPPSVNIQFLPNRPTNAFYEDTDEAILQKSLEQSAAEYEAKKFMDIPNQD